MYNVKFRISLIYYKLQRILAEEYYSLVKSRSFFLVKIQFPLYKVSKVCNRSKGRPEGSFFNSFYTVV